MVTASAPRFRSGHPPVTGSGVCSTAKVDMARGLGADQVIDYSREDFADGPAPLRRDPRHRRQPSALTPPARAHSPGEARHRRRRDRWSAAGRHRPTTAGAAAVPLRQPETGHVHLIRERRRLIALTQVIETGQVKPAIDRSYPLSDVATAIRDLIDGHARGKIVITM